MKRSEVLRYSKIGMETLLTSIKFFTVIYPYYAFLSSLR